MDLSHQERLALMQVALGREPADRVLLGGTLVNVYTLEMYPADVAIKGRAIGCVGDVTHTIGPDTERVDAAGYYLCPGMIETHQHIGGSHLSMTEYGKLSLARGTTALATDLYEPGIVRGAQGVRFCLDELKETGVKPIFLIPLPAYYQNEPFEVLGTFTADEAWDMLHWPDCYGVNEVVMAKLVEGDPFLLRLVAEAQRLGKAVVSHGAAIRGHLLQAALNVAGRTSDHEAVTWDEAREKARLGMAVLVREGSAAADLDAIISGMVADGGSLGDFCFSTDEDDPVRMAGLGYLDAKVRMAIGHGVPPALAIRAASLNAAVHYRVDHAVGGIAPGKFADLVLVRDLQCFFPEMVYAGGVLVGRGGQYVGPVQPPVYPQFVTDTVHLGEITPAQFRIPAPGPDPVRVRVIGARDGTLVAEPVVHTLTPRGGALECDPAADVQKVAVFDRHQRSGRVGLGFIRGFGLRAGAIGSTFNPCAENLVVVGADDRDMAVAANALVEMHGGFVAVSGGQVVARVELPLFAVMSAEPMGVVVNKLNAVHAAIHAMGCPLRSPFHTLAFMVFPGHFGHWKLCSSGLADVTAGRIVPLVLEEENR